MRDQDMADVDVTSPGIWARESDLAYEDLLARELAEEDAGLPPPASDDPRPRARGGRLSEANLKLWLTLVRSISLAIMGGIRDTNPRLRLESEREQFETHEPGDLCSFSTCTS